jgi:hypothetical protein
VALPFGAAGERTPRAEARLGQPFALSMHSGFSRGLAVRLAPTQDETVANQFQQTVAVGFDASWTASREPDSFGNNGLVWIFSGGYARCVKWSASARSALAV